MKDLVLLPEARRDMIDSRRESIRKWGAAHWSNRSAKFVAAFDQVRRILGSGASRSTFFKPMRSVSVDPHIIFYVERNDSIVVVRILDDRRDLAAIDFSKSIP